MKLLTKTFVVYGIRSNGELAGAEFCNPIWSGNPEFESFEAAERYVTKFARFTTENYRIVSR